MGRRAIKMKKILFLTGSRGEWGYIRPILREIEKRNDVEYVLVVTNMHLLPSYGNTYKEILDDGFQIDYKIRMSMDGYDYYTSTKSLGVLLQALPDIIEKERPDWIVLAGDRGEQLMGAIAGAYTYTPVAHIQAGEVSGNIDGMCRHAIGKFVHIHFASNDDAALRLKRLGEEEFRIFNVGAPQLDELVEGKYSSVEEISNMLGIDIERKKYILGVMHPVTEEYDFAERQAEIFIQSLNEFDEPKVIILPNNDAGTDKVKNALISLRKGKYYFFENIKREFYLGMLKNAECIVGNSSSGLLEAPTFKTPAVNIGRRQYKRCRGINVIDVPFKIEKIVNAIRIAKGKDFNMKLMRECENPYGDGHSSKKIIDILLETEKGSRLLVKNLMY